MRPPDLANILIAILVEHLFGSKLPFSINRKQRPISAMEDVEINGMRK
jgi:hypothetical protein